MTNVFIQIKVVFLTSLLGSSCKERDPGYVRSCRYSVYLNPRFQTSANGLRAIPISLFDLPNITDLFLVA